jgi:hypothetical protein
MHQTTTRIQVPHDLFFGTILVFRITIIGKRFTKGGTDCLCSQVGKLECREFCSELLFFERFQSVWGKLFRGFVICCIKNFRGTWGKPWVLYPISSNLVEHLLLKQQKILVQLQYRIFGRWYQAFSPYSIRLAEKMIYARNRFICSPHWVLGFIKNKYEDLEFSGWIACFWWILGVDLEKKKNLALTNKPSSA